MIGKISVAQANAAYQVLQVSKEDQQKAESKDTLETSGAQASGIYDKKAGVKVDPAVISRLKEEAAKASDQLRAYVAKALLNQGNADTQKPDAATVNWAKSAVSEDGDWGVKAVSDRIVDFAKAICGNDKSKIETIKAAIEKGFDEARGAFDGGLPDICNKTHDEIMSKLDNWVNGAEKPDGE